MEGLKNCKKCGKMFFVRESTVLCSTCNEKEEEVFKAIKDYLYDNPGTSIYEMSMKFKLSISRIEYFIRDGRLGVL